MNRNLIVNSVRVMKNCNMIMYTSDVITSVSIPLGHRSR